jgi:DNA-binding transcriptional regulator YiaG
MDMAWLALSLDDASRFDQRAKENAEASHFRPAGGAQMKDSLFTGMMAGFAEAAKHRRGRTARARVSRFSPDVAALRPKEIRKIRTALGLSQADFARYLGTSVACVRSWEQGVRRPQSAALRLLSIAKRKPAALLEFVA